VPLGFSRSGTKAKLCHQPAASNLTQVASRDGIALQRAENQKTVDQPFRVTHSYGLRSALPGRRSRRHITSVLAGTRRKSQDVRPIIHRSVHRESSRMTFINPFAGLKANSMEVTLQSAAG
jgi:hypothetical protein